MERQGWQVGYDGCNSSPGKTDTEVALGTMLRNTGLKFTCCSIKYVNTCLSVELFCWRLGSFNSVLNLGPSERISACLRSTYRQGCLVISHLVLVSFFCFLSGQLIIQMEVCVCHHAPTSGLGFLDIT